MTSSPANVKKMKENTRTAIFLLVAALLAGVTFATASLRRPGGWLAGDESLAALQGTLLFPEFKDPLAATSLEIVRYNQQTGDRTQFEVAQIDGIWSIPSHENYPADAKDHLAAAAASLIDLKVLGVAGDKRTDHALYGVIDPTGKNLAPGTPGVGMKVVMKGDKDKTLVSMIVGKEDTEQPGLRYVRRTGQDVVLTVKLSTAELSTDFGVWIEKDLLKLNSWDLREIFIQDYSIDEVQGHVLLSDEFTLGFDGSADPKWKLLANRQFNKDGQWEDVKLAPDRELNAQRLDAMQTALDDLKIVDVARKPAGLSAELAADKSLFSDAEAKMSLMQRGFFPASVSGKVGIFSNEGETRVLMKDGVEYILRFGGIAGSGAAAEKSEDGTKTQDAGVNRYLFVTAEFNPAPIPKPKLQPLPADEPEKEAPAEGDQKQPEEKKVEDTAAEKSEEDATDKAESPAEPKTKPEANKKADLQNQRERIEKENRREQEAYDQEVAEGKKKVAELNARFADWYYVISESVYDKIHLGRDDIIKKKEAEGDKTKGDALKSPVPAGALPPDAFNQLQAEPGQP